MGHLRLSRWLGTFLRGGVLRICLKASATRLRVLCSLATCILGSSAASAQDPLASAPAEPVDRVDATSASAGSAQPARSEPFEVTVKGTRTSRPSRFDRAE